MKIGFIGLGRMGRGMAANIQKAGYQMVVHDITRTSVAPFEEAGALWAESPAELAKSVDMVFTSLPTPADVEAVGFGAQGLMQGLRPGGIWLDLSTSSVDVVRDMNRRAAAKGVHFLDAPVSGGPGGAASGKLAVWVGGDQAVFDQVRPILDAMSDQARYIGAIGAGTIAKLVHNMAATAFNAVMGEVLTLGVKAGLEVGPLWEAMRSGAGGRMRAFDGVAPRFLQGRLDPANFALRLAHKDVSLALQLGRDTMVPLRICTLVQQEMSEALNRGWGERDSQSFLLLQQERAGVDAFALSSSEVTKIIETT